MTNNPPAFQLFAADFFMDTVEWSVDEVGIYWRLLQAQWINESLPNDMERLARIAGCGPKKFSSGWKKVKSKFQLNGDGRFQNQRLEETREEQRKYRESLSEAGKKGVEKKRKIGSYPFSHPSNDASSHPASPKQALQSSPSLKKDSLRKEHFDLPTQEEINESSIPKIKKDLQKVCDYLYEAEIFSKAHAFKNKMLKEKKSERAVLHTLIRCVIKKEFETTAWAYCMKIIKVENGNYNEYEYGKDKS